MCHYLDCLKFEISPLIEKVFCRKDVVDITYSIVGQTREHATLFSLFSYTATVGLSLPLVFKKKKRKIDVGMNSGLDFDQLCSLG